MSKRRTGSLSDKVYGLVLVAETLGALPREVVKLAHAVQAAMVDKRPRPRLNLSVKALGRHNTNLFGTVMDWLTQPDTRRTFLELGLISSWRAWVVGCERMRLGVRPSTALDNPEGGRPRSWSFSKMRQAAILASYFRRFQGLSLRKAIEKALDELAEDRGWDSGGLDIPTLRRAIADLAGTSDKDIATQTVFITDKPRIPPIRRSTEPRTKQPPPDIRRKT
jgi:hypothetical protein